MHVLQRIPAATLILGLAISGPVLAATSPFTQNGFGTARGSHTVFPYEHVDPASGNLVLVQTDLVLPGNAGFDLVIERVYNSKIHPLYENGGNTTLEERSWVGVGWRLHFGRVINPDSTTSGATQIELGDGSRQPLYTTAAFSEGWMTRSFIRYNRSTHTAKLPNGFTYTFGHLAAPTGLLGAMRYVTEIRDPYDNRLTFTYVASPVGALQQIQQQMVGGQTRVVTFTYDAVTQALATMVYNGRTWSYTTRVANVAGHAQLMNTQRPSNLTRWAYDYDNTLPGGELNMLEAPSGGKVRFTYGNQNRTVGGNTVLTRVVTQRTTEGGFIVPGTWTFAYNQGSNQDTTIVTTPCGVQTYRYTGFGTTGPFPAWTTGVLVERTVEESGTVLEREVLTWQASDTISPDPIPPNAQGQWGDPAVYNALPASRVVTRGPQSWRTTWTYRVNTGTFNDYGSPYEVREYDETYQNVTSPHKLTQLTYQYGFTPWIVGRVAVRLYQLANTTDTGTDSFGYDALTGFMTSQQVLGVTTTFGRNSQGNLTQITDARGNITTMTYSWGVLENTTTPHVTTTRAINTDGTVASETVGGLTTSYTYDDLMRLYMVQPPQTGLLPVEPTFYLQDSTHSRYTTVRRGTLTGLPGTDFFETKTDLDYFGRPRVVTDPAGVKTETQYDACGRATWASRPWTTATGVTGVTTSDDALGRVKQVVDGADASTTTYAYTGIDVTVTDAEGRSTTYDSRAFGDPGSAQLEKVVDADLKQTLYTYNRLGSLTSVTGPGTPGSPGPVRTWTIHAATGRVTSQTQPETGTTTFQYYDTPQVSPLLRTSTDSLGTTFTFAYDGNNRLTTRTTPVSGGNVTLDYDTLGRLWRQVATGATTTYGFDAVGRVVTRQDALDGYTFTQTYAYDRFDRITSLTYPRPTGQGRVVVTYTYDGASRISGVTNNGASFAGTFSHDDGGRLASFFTGLVRHGVTFDARLRPQQVTVGPTGSPALNLTYGYNRTSHVTSIADARPGYNQAFDYDVLYRLRGATGPYGSLSWTYDATGNRLSETRGLSVTNYTYHPTTARLTSTSGVNPESFTYDNAGQTTQDARATYTYFPDGALKQATTPTTVAAYAYDADGWRIKRTVGGSTKYTIRSLGQQTLSEFVVLCGQLAWARDEIYGAGRLIGAVRPQSLGSSGVGITVGFAAAASSVSEPPTNPSTHAVNVQVTTTNGAPLACPVTVNYEVLAGTAAPAADFTPLSGTLTFAAGTASGTTQPITVTVKGDNVDEADETVSVVLTDPNPATLTSTASHLVTILDTDAAPTLTVTAGAASEASSSAGFTVTLSAVSERKVEVTYATADGATNPPTSIGALLAANDYTQTTGVLTFDPGTTSKPVTVPVANDTWAEATEGVALVLSAPVNASIATSTATAAIADNDGTRVPLSTTLAGHSLADETGGPGDQDYLLIANPHATAVTATLTYVLPTGAGITAVQALNGNTRTSISLAGVSGVGNQGPVSVAVQWPPATPLDIEHSTYWGTNGEGGRDTEGVAGASTWYFAEGSSGPYFEEHLTIFNLEPQAVNLAFTFYLANGTTLTRTEKIFAGPGRLRARVRDWIGSTDHGTKIVATRLDNGQPASVVAERTMEWESDRREGHSTPGAPSASNVWHFAEGNVGGFDTYWTFLNPNTTAATAEVYYRHENGVVYAEWLTLPATSRTTRLTPTWMPSGSYGVSVYVQGGWPIVMERSMYGGTNWTVGTGGVGATATGTTWRFAQGIGDWAETYFLVSNPNGAATTASFTFQTQNGCTITANLFVPSQGRATLYANSLSWCMAYPYRTTVTAPQGIVVERAMYWASRTSGAQQLTAGVPSEEESSAALAIDDGGGGVDTSPPVTQPSPYQVLAEGTPLDALTAARASGLTSPEEQGLLDATAKARAAAAKRGAKTGVAGGSTGGATTAAATSLPWISGHVAMGRRP